jgi:hypothetical protein
MQNNHLLPEDMDRYCGNGHVKVGRECRTITYFLSHHLLPEDMNRDCENGQLKVGSKCRTITYFLRIWTEIVKMVSSRLEGIAEPSLAY